VRESAREEGKTRVAGRKRKRWAEGRGGGGREKEGGGGEGGEGGGGI